MFKFLWKKKYNNKKACEKVKRVTLCRPVAEGGLEMITAAQQQQIGLLKWFRKLTADDTLDKEITENMFKEIGGFNRECILNATAWPKCLNSSLRYSTFWRQVIKTWVEVNANTREKKPSELKQILNEPLFCNKNIIYKGNTLYFKKWIQQGILYIHDIYNIDQLKGVNQIKELIQKDPNVLFLIQHAHKRNSKKLEA